jgi:hypothetical protein
VRIHWRNACSSSGTAHLLWAVELFFRGCA